MRVETTYYQTEHRKQPRGYGLWAFASVPHPALSDIVFIHGNYEEAKREAMIRAKANSWRALYVLP